MKVSNPDGKRPVNIDPNVFNKNNVLNKNIAPASKTGAAENDRNVELRHSEDADGGGVIGGLIKAFENLTKDLELENIRADKVARIKKEIQAGTYAVNSRDAAKKIVEELIHPFLSETRGI
ncbi:MAG: flagellar biosynthesis anti-sigma factor FlgM [Deltaproteobacteria bacterium]|nr:flagellar biosynthesis anti-sigma factor FlgM [Deltaproteobacteria bacterium]MCX7953123.1 flagellar biosynthesis anti-sigma factor FlgM [Deltaproteobacteria bacterium]